MAVAIVVIRVSNVKIAIDAIVVASAVVVVGSVVPGVEWIVGAGTEE